MDRYCIVISTLAEYQTKFWRLVSLNLQDKGIRIVVFSFDDRSSEILAQSKIEVINIPRLAKNYLKEIKEGGSSNIFKKFNIENPSFWTNHELQYFRLKNKKQAKLKMASYLCAANEAIEHIQKKYACRLIVQELGGFISCASCYLISQKNNIPHYFLEPSFFPNRLFCVKNTIDPPNIKTYNDVIITDDVKSVLNKIRNSKKINIPAKDTHHFQSPHSKVANLKNIKRLIKKLFDQYLLKKHQEFGHNIKYSLSHLKMIINSTHLRKSYVNLNDLHKFIYFPLHVPNDIALTLRSPEHHDQITLLEQILKKLPSQIVLATKEHPAMIGSFSAKKILTLLRSYKNFKIIAPATNNFDVISKSKGVITINSKSGAEALLLKKNVWVMGKSFYSNCDLVKTTSFSQDILQADALSSIGTQDVDRYFQHVWESSFYGELYGLKGESIRAMVSLIKHLVQKENVSPRQIHGHV